jgi:hypothetical protein
MNPGAPAATYTEFYTFLAKQAKTHDIATPFKEADVMLIKQTLIQILMTAMNAKMMKTVCWMKSLLTCRSKTNL